MAQYDGSVIINSRIETKDLKNDIKELSKRLENLAEAKKRFLESGGSKESSVYKNYISDIDKLKKELDSLKAAEEKAILRGGHFNQLKVDLEEYSQALKDLESQGKYFGDEDYDRVYVAWKNAKDAVKEYQAELNKTTAEGQAREAERVAKEAEKQAAAQRKAEEQAEKALQRENARIQKEIENEDKLQIKEAERQAKIEAEAAEEERLAQIRENAVVGNQHIVDVLERRKQLIQEISDLEKAGVTAGFADYDNRQAELSSLNREIKDYSSNTEKVRESYRKIADIANKALTSAGNTLKKLNSLVDSFAKRIKSAFSRLGKSAKEVNKGFAGISLSLKNILKYGFGIRSLYVLVNKLRSGLKEGFANLLMYSESLENSVNSLKSTALTLKNAFAAAFSPFVEIAFPYVQRLLDYMIQLVNIAGQFFAALTGRKSYIRAIKQTTEALEEETAAMNKQLSPLDKLNNLSSQQGGKDAGAGGTMFEEVPIENGILDAAEKIKDILSKLFEPLKKAWEQEGQFVMDSWKYALEEVWKLIKDIGRDFLKVWNEDETVAVLANILHIIGDIGLVVGNLARNFREAWNTNEVGLNILRNIRDVIGIIVQHIRNAADATVEWADKLDFYPLLDAFNRFLVSIKPVVDAIWGVLEDFYTHVLLPLAKWTVEKGLPELLQVFIDFNNKVDWDSLRKNLAEFWNHLEPFAETVGEGLIIFIRRVSDALADFLNSQEFKDFLVTIENWMDSVTPEDVADALEMIAKGLISLKLALLGYSAIKGITSILTTIKAFLAFFGVGGGAAGAGAAMESTAQSAGLLATALGDLAVAAAGVGIFDVAIKNPLFDLMEAMGADADKIDLMREKYGKFGGTIDIVKDTFSVLKNSLQGYGAVVSDTSQLSKALEIAMEDIANGAILSDEHMAQLKERFGATNDDLEILRQEMLDTNPALRELADGFPALATASAESLEQINKGLQYMENGVTDADDIIFRLNHSFGELTPTTEAFFNQMENNSLEDFNYAMQTGEQVIDGYVASLENTSAAVEQFSNDIVEAGTNIGEGLTAGMENVDTDSPAKGFFDKIVESIKSVFNMHSPAKNMNPFGENIFLGMVEGFKNKFTEFTTLISQLFTQISSKFISGMNAVKNIWISAWSALPNTVKNIINSIMSMVSSFVSSLSSAFSKVSSFGSKISGSFKNFNISSAGVQVPVSPVVAALSNVEIPAYATGQVIPRTMKQHLAILGDNSQETEVVSPLSTMKQAVVEALNEAGFGGMGEGVVLSVTLELDGDVLLTKMQKLNRQFFKQNGRGAFT